jgi:hypothetical protein
MQPDVQGVCYFTSYFIAVTCIKIVFIHPQPDL